VSGPSDAVGQRARLRLLGGGCVGLFALAALLGAVTVLVWRSGLREVMADYGRRVERAGRNHYAEEAVRARLAARAGLARARVELREASRGGPLPSGPLAGTLGVWFGVTDLYEVAVSRREDGGFSVEARGQVAWGDHAASDPEAREVLAEHVIRATVSADGDAVEVLEAVDAPREPYRPPDGLRWW